MQQVKHTVPMLHIATLDATADVFNHCLDMLRMGARSIAAEVKLDGLSCDLTYVDGHLTLATIRGEDVLTGYDVTEVARRAQKVPTYIKHHAKLVVRGVLVLPIQVMVEHAKYFTNPLHTRKCVREALAADHYCHTMLEYVMADYVLVDADDSLPDAHKLIKEFVHTGSCRTHTLRGFNENDFRSMMARINTIKVSNRYDSCGLIFKIRSMLVGEPGAEYYTGMFNLPEARVTTFGEVRSAWWSVTKSGKLTPYYTISEDDRQFVCNLHNQRNAIRCATRVGDTVLIDRRGPTPPIVRGLHSSNGGAELPLALTDCPSCGHPLTMVGQDPHCMQDNCNGRNESMLRFILGRAMFNAPRLSDVQIGQLWAMICRTEHPVQIGLFKIPAFEVSQELYDTIQRHMVVPLYKALGMLNLPALSLVSLKNLAQEHSTLQNVFLAAGNMRNEREREILLAWWANPEHRSLVYKMDRFFVYGTPSTKTFDRNVCLTGRFRSTRAVLIKKLNADGFGVHGSLTARTDAVLAGESAGTVVRKANERKIPVVASIDELKKLW